MPYKDPQKAKEYYGKNKERKKAVNQKWAENNREKSNAIKTRYVKDNPEKRRESWSKYNSSEKGRKNKKQWYEKWKKNLGVMDWDDWVMYRKNKATTPEDRTYPKEFNAELKEKIKERDDYQCKMCSMVEPISQALWGRSLAVHHIDYNKKNCDPMNLTTLCIRCNSAANYYREYWEVYHGIENPRVFVVIPSVRAGVINTMLRVWQKELEEATIIVVEDNEHKTFDLSEFKNVIHFSHEDIENDLGEHSWIIPRKTSAIASYGFYKAYKMGADVVIKIDDDLLVRESGFIEKHIENLFTPRSLFWVNVFEGNGVYPRGFPYTERTRLTVLNYGLADNILDLDAPTQILGQNSKISQRQQAIPYGSYFPLCGMNVAFLRDIIPAYYFLLQGGEYGIDRYDDIWSGVFLKKITDHLNHVISVGEPIVTHNKLSDPITNLEKESGGIDINECLWQEVNEIKLTQYSYKDCYIELSNKLNLPIAGYGDKLKEAMRIWANLFD